MTGKNDWIGEKILAQEDKLMEQLHKASADRTLGLNPEAGTHDRPPSDAPLPEPVPRDPDAERRAYEELLAHLNTPDDGDADTLVEALSLDHYDSAANPTSEE